jgi:hypothetical protein
MRFVKVGETVHFLSEYPVEVLSSDKRPECKELYHFGQEDVPVLALTDSPKYNKGDMVLIPRAHLFKEKEPPVPKITPYPEGQIKYYAGCHPVEILPESEYVNCNSRYPKYKLLSVEVARKRCYPCLILRGFTTTETNITFEAGEKTLLKKSFLHRKSKRKITRRSIKYDSK